MGQSKPPVDDDKPAAPPEADLENRLTAVLAQSLPHIPRSDLKTQRRFKVRLGHETYEHDSAAAWEKSGRADILVFYQGRPLAVVDLKREDLTLTDTDAEQAQSYANQLTPRPPLVIVSNGKTTRLYDSSTLEPWSADGEDAKAVAALLANVGKVAADGMRWAIEALMGRETNLWVPALRAQSTALLSSLTDQPGASGRPFARDLLFPRRATCAVHEILTTDAFGVVIGGAPSAGKSSILRELVVDPADSDDIAVLMLRAGGPGLFQALANLFAQAFEWTLSANDARHWLRRLARGDSGPVLVLAIDGVEPGSTMAQDLEELASLAYGPRLKVVITTDHPEALLKTANRRGSTALGACCAEVEVGPLDRGEFRAAMQVLHDAKILFLPGADQAEDYRAPWLLRFLYDSIAREPRYAETNLGLLLAPALGVEWIDAAETVYADQPDMLRGYRVLARDALAADNAGAVEVALAACNTFVVRQDVLSPEGRDAIKDLRDAGWITTSRLGGQDIVAPTAPAAFMMELAAAAGEELARRSEDDEHAAGVWLGERLDLTYLGDLVGAQAIRYLAKASNSFSSGIIWGLLSIEPEERENGDMFFAVSTQDGELLHLKIEEGKIWQADRQGNKLGEPQDLDDEPSRTLANTTAWMILGQFARMPTAPIGEDDVRMDASILFEIGRCKFPLLRASQLGRGFLEHDLGELGRLVCQDAGAIEATTQAMADLLSRPWRSADAFVDEALESDCLPLIHRVMIALQTVVAREIPELSDWAQRRLADDVLPKVRATVATGLEKQTEPVEGE